MPWNKFILQFRVFRDMDRLWVGSKNFLIFWIFKIFHLKGLSITLQPEVEQYISDTKTAGTFIFVHGPFEYPDTKVSYLLGTLATDVNIAVIPHVVESSNEIRALPLKKRKCYFQDEVSISYNVQFHYSIDLRFRKNCTCLVCIVSRDVWLTVSWNTLSNIVVAFRSIILIHVSLVFKQIIQGTEMILIL